MVKRSEKQGSAVDLLETEDRELRQLFSTLRSSRGPEVEERAKYGDAAKEIIRHLATREAALVNVSDVALSDPTLRQITERLQNSMQEHRPLIDRVEKMSRGVQGMNLRTGQDFDGEMEELMEMVGAEIEWDLGEALPTLRAALEAGHEDDLKTAEYLTAHAPTSLHPDGPQWWERAPILSRVITIYDRLRDFPKAKASG